MTLGWNAEETSPYPIDQERKIFPFSQSSSFEGEVIINY